MSVPFPVQAGGKAVLHHGRFLLRREGNFPKAGEPQKGTKITLLPAEDFRAPIGASNVTIALRFLRLFVAIALRVVWLARRRRACQPEAGLSAGG